MNCPPEIDEIICRILQHGILQFRCGAWEGDTDVAAKIADHLHNLPQLLTDFSPEKLKYYWETERPCFLEAVDDSLTSPYADLWDRLEDYVVESKEKSEVSLSQD